ncbi:Alpha-xylosidase [Phycisphaerae bacterium RAS1]|nr:Alpha-xylosidase [Phycisphaerae bacterium RAS1]
MARLSPGGRDIERTIRLITSLEWSLVLPLVFSLAAAATARGDSRLELDPRSGRICLRRIDAKEKPDCRVRLAPPHVDGRPQADFTAAPAASAPAGASFDNAAVRITLEPPDGSSHAIIYSARDGAPHDIEICIEDNSSYYGGGERFNALNQKGFILPMASIDRPEPKGVVSYKPVPLYMSTRGYGLWVDSFAPGEFDLNATDRDHVRLRYRAARVRIVLIDGPDFATILNEFTRLSGRPRVPPVWSLAPWKSRNIHNNRDEVLADAELTRKHDLPGSMIVIDSPWETCYNDFTLNERQFTQPAAMFDRVRELGFYPCLWLTPFVNVENVVDTPGIEPGPCANFEEGRQRGFFVKQPGGEPMIVAWWKGRGALVDFTNPAAKEWWLAQLDKMRPWGVRALKCDDGEGNFVQDAVFFDGTPAAEMKNRYAKLYLEAAQEWIDTRLDGDGVLHSRCGFSGTQRQPFGWAGDNDATFSFENGLPGVILAGQNTALSGLPLWGHDIAGYMGTPSEELFIRWTQFGALSPMMQVHMTCNRGPWDFGDRALAIYRDFATLHMRLTPYVMDAAVEASRSGMPIIRPMVLAFPGDREAAAHQYQYMFGPDLLFAPMYQPGTRRSVYLPKQSDGAAWLDYWTGQPHDGGQPIELDVPLERAALFVRGGAIICTLPAEIDTLIPRFEGVGADVMSIDDRRVIEVWPGPDREIQTFEGIGAVSRESGRLVDLQSKRARPVELRFMRGGVQDVVKRAVEAAPAKATYGPE